MTEQPFNMLALLRALQSMNVRICRDLPDHLANLLICYSEANRLFSPLLSTRRSPQAYTRCKTLPEKLIHNSVRQRLLIQSQSLTSTGSRCFT